MKLERWGWYSVLVNVLLASLHGLIAWMSGSLAVFAERVHNLIDLLGAVAVLVGIGLATRRSRAFPYGLYKIDRLVALGLAGLVLLTAYEITRDALFTQGGELKAEPWMFGLLNFAADFRIPSEMMSNAKKSAMRQVNPAPGTLVHSVLVHRLQIGMIKTYS